MEVIKVMIYLLVGLSWPKTAPVEMDLTGKFIYVRTEYVQQDSLDIKFNKDQIIYFFDEPEKTLGVLKFNDN